MSAERREVRTVDGVVVSALFVMFVGGIFVGILAMLPLVNW